ncbi:MAG: flagellar assembly protein FliW [Deltaproteobacteria bacterium]|nr:flagellar assembly protein FliW [Deltaproteobacteria bacterium]NCP04302.1 flagellar assembly protein FliW [Deltaproteobacteria bacterium]NCP78740.1 flagellar assembly protein FliW [Desulfuromonadales bacterium]
MKKVQSRFGEIEYDPESTLHFPEGLIGFENLHHFVVMPNEKDGPLFWIQSTEDPLVAFILTDPTGFYYDYRVVPDGNERRKLGIGETDECHVVSVVSVSPERQITLNLAAPILFAPATNRALQVILEGTNFSPRTPLPTVEPAQATATSE